MDNLSFDPVVAICAICKYAGLTPFQWKTGGSLSYTWRGKQPMYFLFCLTVSLCAIGFLSQMIIRLLIWWVLKKLKICH